MIPKDSKVTLFRDLQEIGSWERLCTYLRVSESLMDELRHSDLEYNVKKERCLSAYVISGKARWDHVVKVVCSHPFNNIILGKRIAAKYKVPVAMCTLKNQL